MKHGACSGGKISKTYTSWYHIKSSYTDEVCDRWQEFKNFLCDMGDKPDGYCLKRIDDGVEYRKDNCLWLDKRPKNTGKKVCVRCKEEKTFDLFIKNIKMNFGVGSYCKKCASEMRRETTNKIKNMKKDVPDKKECSLCGKTKDRDCFVEDKSSSSGLSSDCKKCRNEKKKQYRVNQKNKFKKNGVVINTKICCVCNIEKPSSEFYIKKSESDHLRSECKECSTKLFAKNRENINFRIAMSLRERLRSALKGGTKNKKTLEYLGCSVERLKEHLEEKFADGMTWENYGRYGWHIDHIKPISLFDLSQEEEIKKACHYTNLQPLWAEDNMKKGAKYNE
jgi:bacterioferritin-associated ferredoxin